MTQKWKSDKNLYDCPTKKDGNQINKDMDYYGKYVDSFIKEDPIRDWESVSRAHWLFKWALQKIEDKIDTVLDCGCKDALFVSDLRGMGYNSLGVEIDDRYVKYATEKGRPIYKADVCNLTFEDNQFDLVFSHHLHGLTPSYLKTLQEMFRVSSKYMICLNQVPGNKRKHYSYIDSPKIFNEFIDSVDCEVLHNDYLETGYAKEWVLFLKKGE